MKEVSNENIALSTLNVKRRKEESLQSFVGRLTHVSLTGKGIVKLENFESCRKLVVLYLFDNSIEKIENLHYCSSLTQLYLQHNRIKKIENLGHLKNLNKLFLGHNEISVVEGLHELPSLTELHLEHQSLSRGDKLVFEPRTLDSLSASLLVLNISGNNVDDISELASLRSLSVLNVSLNKIPFPECFEEILLSCDLLKLFLIGNPVCDVSKYKEEIISYSHSLKQLDEKEITDLTREFIVNMKGMLRNRGLASPEPRSHSAPNPPLPSSSRVENRVVFSPPVPKFPSKFSSKNPHWLPPLPRQAAKGKGRTVNHQGKQQGGFLNPSSSNFGSSSFFDDYESRY